MDRTKILSYIKRCIKVYIVLLFLSFSGFSCSKSIPEFDGEKAYNYLIEQCEFGPRAPNTEAHKNCKDYLSSKLQASADIYRKQEFIYYDEKRQDTLRLTNLIASFNPRFAERILLCTHWDTRPWADSDPDSSLHNMPVPGASDGASGVAVLLVIAEIFKNNHPLFGVDIVFFDGEDYGQSGTPDEWLLGSKYFTENIGGYRPQYVVLLDLIGDTDLNIHKEYYSQTYAGWLVSKVWKAAALENAQHFHNDIKHNVYDDHVPFLEIGIPAVNIVDMDYKWWHTVNDTPDKCSAESLAEVGRVVLRLIYDKDLH